MVGIWGRPRRESHWQNSQPVVLASFKLTAGEESRLVGFPMGEKPTIKKLTPGSSNLSSELMNLLNPTWLFPNTSKVPSDAQNRSRLSGWGTCTFPTCCHSQAGRPPPSSQSAHSCLQGSQVQRPPASGPPQSSSCRSWLEEVITVTLVNNWMGSQDVQLRVKLSFCAGSLLNWVIRMELLILLVGVSVSLPGWKAELSVFCQGPRKATHFPSDVFFLTRIRMVKPLWKL